MASIQTAIALQDNFTDVLFHVVSSVDLGISAMEGLHQTMEDPVDMVSLDAARESIDQATIAAQELDAAMQGIGDPNIGMPAPAAVQDQAAIPFTPAAGPAAVPPAPAAVPDPPNIPVQWQADSLEVFSSEGVQRFSQEVQSANAMLSTLNQTQGQVAQAAAQIDMFPPDAVTDMNSMQNRLQLIQQRMAQITGNPMNIGTDAANAGLEQMRGQFAQIEREQEALNHAVNDMDIQAANAAYLRLSQTVGNTERYIRDNVDEQGRFNMEIQQGASEAGNLMDTIKGAVAAYATIQTVSKALGLSDQLTATTARLDMMNDGLQSTQDLQNMIFLSAERSRGAYQATADAVSKLGLMAGDAFGSTEEIVAFMEQVNKQFTIAGTESAGIDAAMLQLTQAMGSGILRGEEFNSILEQAPNIIQSIADYMGVPKGQLKELAAEGEISAAIVKEAMFAAAEDTNAKFESMPKTFEQIWTSFENHALMAFQPVLARMNEVANSEAFQQFVEGAIDALSAVSGIAIEIFDLLATGAGMVADNWSWLAPIIGTVTAALVAYYIALGIYNAIQLASNGIKAAAALAEQVHAASLAMEAGATFGATAAQYGFNAALLACPITWIIILIIALAAAFVLLWDKCEGFRNFVIDMWAKNAKAVASFYNNTWVPAANGMIAIQNGLVQAIADSCRSAINNFADLAIAVVESMDIIREAIAKTFGVYNSVAEFFNLPTIDIDYALSADGINNVRNEALAAVDSWAITASADMYQPIDEAKFNGWVDNIADQARDFTFSGFIDDMLAGLFGGDGIPNPEDYNDLSQYPAGFDEMGSGIDEIAGNTGAIRDALEVTQEDLKYLRDLAEQEAVNRYTVAEVNIDMSGMQNNINSDDDIDGFMAKLTDSVNEAVDSMTEGVHE